MKGFTLIEMLAVIVLMSLLVLLAFSSISFLTKQREGDIEEVKLKTFYNNVEVYMNEYPNVYSERDFHRYCIPVTDFIANSKYKEKDFIEMYKISNVANYVINVEFINASNYEVSVTETANCVSGYREEKIKDIKLFGGSLYDEPTSIVALPTGEMFVIGTTNSIDGSFSGEDNKGKNDAFIMKIDKDYNVLWAKKFGSAENDSFEYIEIIDNIIYVMGITTGSTSINDPALSDFAGMSNLPQVGESAVMFFKFDQVGNVIDKNFIMSGLEWQRGPIYTDDGFFMAGMYGKTISTTNPTLATLPLTTTPDIYVMKISKDLEMSWIRAIQGNSTEVLSLLSGEGDEIMVSFWPETVFMFPQKTPESTFTGDYTGSGDGCLQVAKFDTNGNLKFFRSHGDSAFDNNGLELFSMDKNGFNIMSISTSATDAKITLGMFNSQGNLTKNLILADSSNATFFLGGEMLPATKISNGFFIWGTYYSNTGIFANSTPVTPNGRDFVIKFSPSGKIENIVDFGTDELGISRCNSDSTYITGDGLVLVCWPNYATSTFTGLPSSGSSAMIKINLDGEIDSIKYYDEDLNLHNAKIFVQSEDSTYFVARQVVPGVGDNIVITHVIR